MSNQIVISSGAKVRSLEGVLTGSAGIVSSVPLGGANGVATLDSSGKVPLSQLPASVVTYLGTWNAASNTPTLTNGTGDAGDMYICNVAGTVNFGAGPITFAVGDWVIYNGSQWQKSSGASGTVTSVAVTESGDALNITGSPITTAGTINIGFAGSSTQYINGEGNLVTFPTLITEAQNLITDVYNETGATLTKGTVVYINGGHGNLPTVTKALATSDATSAQTYGVVQADITNNNNGHVVVIGSLGDLDTQAYPAGTQLYLSSTTAGAWTSVKQYAPAHLVYVGIVVRSHPTQGVVEIKIQNGFELDELHNVSAQTPSNGDILQYNSTTSLWTSVAGTTTNIAEGTNLYFTNARAIGSTLTGYVSGAGTISSTDSILTAIQKLNGNVSGLVTGVSSVFGRTGAVVAASGDYTTTEVTEGTNLYFTNARARGAMSANVGSALTYDSATGRYTLLAADSGTSGYLTAADWTDFDSKQASLGTGTTSQYLRGDLTWATPPTPALDDLTDVVITSPTNGQVLTYRFGDWKNETPASAPVTSVFGRTGVVVATSGDYNTDLVTEGTTNLYYTNTRARAALSANVGSALTYNSSTGRFTLNAADGTTEGYVTAADYNYWDAKQASLGTGTTSQWLRGDLTWSSVPAPALDDLTDVTITTPSNGQLLRYQTGTWINFTPTYISLTALSANAPLSYNSTTGVFSISQATTSTNGYLSSTDWNTFNNKQSALTNPVTGTGTTNYLPKFTGTSAIGNSLIYDNGTNVGIGTASPNELLSLNATGNVNIHLTNATSGTTTNDGFKVGFNTSLNAYLLNKEAGSILFYTSDTLRATLDASGNLGLGATPSAWSAGYKSIQVAQQGGTVFGNTTISSLGIASNGYYDGTNWVYNNSDTAGQFRIDGNVHKWYNAASGTAGNAISFTQAMTLDASGRLLIGSTNSTNGLLVINSTASNGVRFALESSGTMNGIVAIGSNAISGLSTTDMALWTRGVMAFETGASGEKMRITTGGNLLVGTTTDAGYKLDVNGTGRFSGLVRVDGQYVQIVNASNPSLYLSNTTVQWQLKNNSSNNLVFNDGAADRITFAYGGAATFSNAVTAPTFNIPSYSSNSGAYNFAYSGNAASRSWRIVNDITVYGDFAIQQSTTQTGTSYANKFYLDNNGAATFSGQINTTSASGLNINPGTSGNATLTASTNASSYSEIQASAFGVGYNMPLILQRQGGNVGIGTSSPSYKLDVNGSQRWIFRNNSSEITDLLVSTESANSISKLSFLWYGNETAALKFLRGDDSTGSSISLWTQPTGGSTTERIRIKDNGNVGIGTSSPLREMVLYRSSGEVHFKIANGTTGEGTTDGFDMAIDSSGGAYLINRENQPMYFFTNGSERMRITSSGNVGIGTTSPDNGVLTIVKNTAYNTENSYAISIQSFSTNAYTELQLGAADAVDCGVIQTAGKNTSWTSKKLALQPNGGNVGIGTTSPSKILTVRHGAADGVRIEYSGGTDNMFIDASNISAFLGTSASFLKLNPTGGNVAIGTTTDAGYKLDVNGTGRFSGNITGTADLTLTSTGGHTLTMIATSGGSQTIQMTSAGGGSSTLSSTGGDFQIRTTDAKPIVFQTNGTENLRIASGGAATFTSSVTATGFFESSDKRLKKEISDNPTIQIESIKPKLYIKDGKEELGYYAQDLQEILPSSVTEGKDGFLSLSYTQVHTAKIAALENKIEQLEALIKTLIK